MFYLMVEEKVYYIVVKMTGSQSLKGYQPLISKSCSILRITHPSPPYRLIGHNQVFLIDRNVTVKLSSIKTIHVKLQHNVGFLIFKYTLKYMLVNVYINKMNIRKWLYIISYIIGEVFFPCFQFLCCIQRNPSRLISNSQEEKTLSYYVRLFQEIFNTCVFRRFPALVWQNAHVNTVRRMMVCISLFLRFCSFLKKFCAHIHSILSRRLFLYLTDELVRTFLTYNKFGVSLSK